MKRVVGSLDRILDFKFGILVKQRGERGANSGFPDLKFKLMGEQLRSKDFSPYLLSTKVLTTNPSLLA